MTSICSERWFQIVERLQRPLWRWFMGIPPFAYAMRGAFGADFSEGIFLAMCVPPGAAYISRGWEKLKEKELEQ